MSERKARALRKAEVGLRRTCKHTGKVNLLNKREGQHFWKCVACGLHVGARRPVM